MFLIKAALLPVDLVGSAMTKPFVPQVQSSEVGTPYCKRQTFRRRGSPRRITVTLKVCLIGKSLTGRT
jgi:hypothetical protein